MDDMSTRFKAIRKTLGLTQKEFGEAIGVSRDFIANIELGRVEAKDLSKKMVCMKYRVNPRWLETGEGDMFLDVSREDELMRWAGSVLQDVNDTFKKRLIMLLSELSESDWEALESFALKLAKKNEGSPSE